METVSTQQFLEEFGLSIWADNQDSLQEAEEVVEHYNLEEYLSQSVVDPEDKAFGEYARFEGTTAGKGLAKDMESYARELSGISREVGLHPGEEHELYYKGDQK
ncbi:MAG: hypothetical protein ACI8Z7_000022 [Candidatus Nanohaloarchaea archaeon]|jgi:hypothetical protein